MRITDMLRLATIAILGAVGVGAVALPVEEANQLRAMFSEAAAEAPPQCIEAPKINNISRLLLNPDHPAGATLWPQTDIYLAYKANGKSPLAAALQRETEDFDDEWVNILCPEVVEYFKRAPYFDNTAFPGRYPPLLTTNAAASAVCLLRVFDAACRSARNGLCMQAVTSEQSRTVDRFLGTTISTYYSIITKRTNWWKS